MSTAVLHDLPMPARLAPWPRARQTTLLRCLWLAALLHGLALLWLGSAPEGTAPPGQGAQGRLNVTLRGPGDEGQPSPPPRLGLETGAAPADSPPRLGGRVRDTELPAERAPGAERLGPAPVPAPTLLPATAPALPPTLPPVAEPPPAAPAPPPAALAPEPAVRALGAEPAPPRSRPPEPLAAPPALAEALPVPPLPTLAPLPSTPELPAEGRLDAGALRAVAPAAVAPLVPPAPATAPRLPAWALPALGEALAPPPPAAAQARPATAPPLATPPESTSAAVPLAAPAAAAGPAAPAPAGPVSPRAPAAADTGPRLGADVAVPATAASAPRPLNLELGRLRGGELSRLGAPGVLPVLPRPPETDKLGAEIEKAAREDCRKAHAGAGLLAVVPLAVDTLRGKGCKW